jgi:hypothetical protein
MVELAMYQFTLQCYHPNIALLEAKGGALYLWEQNRWPQNQATNIHALYAVSALVPLHF